ncbi:hypothetical protein HDV00_009402 [Rhizophlyctis rosea]|nr:hypothetical protein HDV00_009402 [Rhizophlyctis rosea]
MTLRDWPISTTLSQLRHRGSTIIPPITSAPLLGFLQSKRCSQAYSFIGELRSLRGDSPSEAGDEYDDLKEQDRFLPIANVARIMKRALPDNAKIAKDAKECVQECVSEFISFVTSEASDRCQLEKRKTINGEDILWAMQSLGFENYCETLKVYLHKYRETLNSYTAITQQAKGAAASGSSHQTDASSHLSHQPQQPQNPNLMTTEQYLQYVQAVQLAQSQASPAITQATQPQQTQQTQQKLVPQATTPPGQQPGHPAQYIYTGDSSGLTR